MNTHTGSFLPRRVACCYIITSALFIVRDSLSYFRWIEAIYLVRTDVATHAGNNTVYSNFYPLESKKEEKRVYSYSNLDSNS